MPIITSIGAWLIYPLSGDYCGALTLSYAVAVSAAITMLFAAIYVNLLLIRQNSGSPVTNILPLYLFFICHFWIFRTAGENNDYMFKTIDASTYFYYVIPNIMNAVLAIWYKLDYKVRWPAIKQHYLRGGIFLFAIYFCMFSNIFASVIMAVYIGTAMGYDLAEDLIKKRYNTVSYCRKHVMEFIILLAWGTAQVFEINGKRSEWAENLSGGQKYLDFLRESFKEGIRVLLSMKKGFMLVMLVIVAIGIISIIKNKNHVAEKECVLWGVSAMMMTLYLVLSCAKVAPRYITRSDVFYGVFFFGMMVVLTCLEQIMNRFLIFRIAIPLILFVITVNCNTEGKTFQESTVNSIDSDICMAVSEDIIAQMMEAERAGMTEIVLYVPEFSTTDNWPLATYANNRFSEHLWKYNILKHKIRIICVQPSMEKNKELHLP